ncbi:MAG: M56 family metallopeptidase [Oscillospiraceae bacterium]
MGNELFTSYSELGFGAFMSTVTVGIFLYVLIVKLFDVLFHNKFPNGWKYALAVVIPVFLLIPVKIWSPWTIIPLDNFNLPLFIRSPEPIFADGVTEINSYFTGAAAEADLLYNALFYIWLAGAVITFAYQMIKLATLYKAVRMRSIPCANHAYNAILEQICRENKVKLPELIIFPETDTPFAMGIFRAKIILPSEEFSEKEIGFILRHEVTHIRRRDILIKLLLMIFRCINWFDPLAYIMVKNAYEDMEITCDERASKGFSDEEREEYSRTILKGVSRAKYPAVTTYLSPTAKLTKKRISAVMTVKKLGSAIPFVLAFCSVTLLAQTFYALPDDNTKAAFYYYIDPYTMESDPYITSDGWKTAEAASVSEAGEKIFRQYMEMYMGGDVPDYYRIDDYCINNVYVPGENEKENTPAFLADWMTKGVFTQHEYVSIDYNFMTADQCGNTVHNKNFGHDAFLNGVYSNCCMGFELEKDGDSYTVVNIGAVGIYGSTDYHFDNNLTGDGGFLLQASEMAQSGLFDYSWNDTDDLPDPQDICEYEYLQRYDFQMTQEDPDPEQTEYFPTSMAFMTSMDIIGSEHIAKADCRYLSDDGTDRIDTSKLFYDESKGFEYCGYEHDPESGASVVYGNVTGTDPHGVKMYIYTADSNNYYLRKLHAVEVTDELYTPYEFHDSFDSIALPDDITSAEDILGYMKTPRDGCDFTVMDYRNITEEKDGVYAEVRFKGRLDGQYSADLTENGGDGYLKTKII